MKLTFTDDRQIIRLLDLHETDISSKYKAVTWRYEKLYHDFCRAWASSGYENVADSAVVRMAEAISDQRNHKLENREDFLRRNFSNGTPPQAT